MSDIKQNTCAVVQLEIHIEKLELLFSKGVICATDLRPLNSQSKISLWNLCLSSCAKKFQCKMTHINPPNVRCTRRAI